VPQNDRFNEMAAAARREWMYLKNCEAEAKRKLDAAIGAEADKHKADLEAIRNKIKDWRAA